MSVEYDFQNDYPFNTLKITLNICIAADISKNITGLLDVFFEFCASNHLGQT